MALDLAALEKPITRILRAPGTDLATISAKRVRKALLEDPAYAYLGLTVEVLKTRRGEVDEVIGRMFQEVSRGEEDQVGDGEGAKEDDVGDEEPGAAEAEAEDKTPRKARKKTASRRSVEESDAALARRLSSEINSRSTRRGASLVAAAAATGGSSSSPRKGKRKVKRSAATVESEDEDEVGGDTRPKKRRAAKGGFAKEYTLSVPLSAVLATERMSRPQVVKKLWEYIRQNTLQNPLNKREILCDDALRAVFSVDKIDMFRMNKVLGQHLHE